MFQNQTDIMNIKYLLPLLNHEITVIDIISCSSFTSSTQVWYLVELKPVWQP